METFGQVVAAARKALGISQKDLAALVRKDDGGAISPQYLNDIEHDRRGAPSDFIIGELAKHLRLSKEYLTLTAGMIPSDVRAHVAGATPESVERAVRAFRKQLKKRS